MYESKRQKRKKGAEYLAKKLNALNLERSKDGEIYPSYYVVNFTSDQMSAISMAMGVGFMMLAAVIIRVALPSGGVIGVLSLVGVACLTVCAMLSAIFAVNFIIAWLNPAEDVIEIGYSDREMHFLSDKIAEARRAMDL